jgi:hypothetical protein
MLKVGRLYRDETTNRIAQAILTINGISTEGCVR